MNRKIGAIVLATVAITVGSTVSAEAVTVKPSTDIVPANVMAVGNASTLAYPSIKKIQVKEYHIAKNTGSIVRPKYSEMYGKIWYVRDTNNGRITRIIKWTLAKNNHYNHPNSHIDVVHIGRGNWQIKYWAYFQTNWTHWPQRSGYDLVHQENFN